MQILVFFLVGRSIPIIKQEIDLISNSEKSLRPHGFKESLELENNSNKAKKRKNNQYNNNVKKNKQDDDDFFKKLTLENLEHLKIQENQTITSNILKLQENDFNMIYNSFDQCEKIPELSVKEKTFLCQIFPYIGGTRSLKDTIYMYLKVVKNINRMLINLLEVYCPNTSFENYKITNVDYKDYFVYKGLNKTLFNMLKNKKIDLKNQLADMLDSDLNASFNFKLEYSLRSEIFPMKALYNAYNNFRSRYRCDNRIVILLFNTIDNLRSLHLFKHLIPNNPSYFLFIISNLKSNNSMFYLFYFNAFLKSILLIMLESENNKAKKILIANNALLFQKISYKLTNSAQRNMWWSLSKLKKSINHLRFDKVALKKARLLFKDFFYFMVASDIKIGHAHNRAMNILDFKDMKIDLIYYGLYKELEDVYNEVILN